MQSTCVNLSLGFRVEGLDWQLDGGKNGGYKDSILNLMVAGSKERSDLLCTGAMNRPFMKL